MQEIFLGEFIRRKRVELGLTQEALCCGICEPATISRLERGKQTPSRGIINALLERLDVPADRYFALLSANELEVLGLQKKITSMNVRFCNAAKEERPAIRSEALRLHSELEALIDPEDRLSRQLILRSRVILGKSDGPYSPSEQHRMLLEAIRLTCPSFSLASIENGLFTTDEVKVINQLALVHAYSEDHESAIAILKPLYGYIRKHFRSIPPYQAHLGLIAFNYSRELEACALHEEALRIAEEGIDMCIHNGHYASFPDLLSVAAEACHFLGNDERSLDLYYQTYYITKALNDRPGLQYAAADIKRYFGIDLPSQISSGFGSLETGGSGSPDTAMSV